MNSIGIAIFIVAIALIVGAVMLLKHSAKKFRLSEQQLKNIKKREKKQLIKDDEQS